VCERERERERGRERERATIIQMKEGKAHERRMTEEGSRREKARVCEYT
jgi:hypothetical protein